MKSTELRIGNLFWVLHEDWESVKEVTIKVLQELEKFEDNPDDECWSRGGPDHYYSYIPLCDDLLSKIGAVRPHNDNRIQIGELCFYGNSDKLFLSDSGFNEAISEHPIQYFHQLQNVYFDLTGQELTTQQVLQKP